jgi:8-oxo-dGTP pyrophosphatase MutT (NUDIX family)
MTGLSTPVPRTSARVILLDRENRVLLFTGTISSRSAGATVAWFLPGGGAEGHETLAATAARELFEETGLRIGPDRLHGPVGVSRGLWNDGATTYQAEDFVFVLRIPRWVVTTDGFTPLERRQVTGYRWWILPELQHTDAVVFPNLLASLVADAIEGALPGHPVELPWRAS